MTYIIIAILLALLIFQWRKQRRAQEDELYEQMVIAEEFKRTVALGLYQRFCKEDAEKDKKYSSTYIKNDPIEFEHFVADALKHRYGYDTYVTKPSGDFGVDTEHGSGDGKVLGQVKCLKDDMNYEPIAILHSNMVKQNASKGYVVTTGGFTKNAYLYANGLNIDLITGPELVDWWINYSHPINKHLDYEAFNQTLTDTMSV